MWEKNSEYPSLNMVKLDKCLLTQFYGRKEGFSTKLMLHYPYPFLRHQTLTNPNALTDLFGMLKMPHSPFRLGRRLWQSM